MTINVIKLIESNTLSYSYKINSLIYSKVNKQQKSTNVQRKMAWEASIELDTSDKILPNLVGHKNIVTTNNKIEERKQTTRTNWDKSSIASAHSITDSDR